MMEEIVRLVLMELSNQIVSMKYQEKLMDIFHLEECV